MSEQRVFTEEEIADLRSMAAAQSQVAILSYNIRREYEENMAKLDSKMDELKKKTGAKIEELRRIADVPPSWKFDMSKRVFVQSA